MVLLSIAGLLTLLVTDFTKIAATRLAFRQGNELLNQKLFNLALMQYNQLLNIDSNYFQAWTNRGYAFAGLGRYEDMQESCSTATVIEPQASYAWNCRGEALYNQQRYNKALAAFERAIALNQGDPIFLINKSESLTALGRKEESMTVIQQAIQELEQIKVARGKEHIRQEFAVALTVLGNGWHRQQQYENAARAYQRALSYSSDYFPAHLGQGISLISLEKYQQAQNQLEMLLRQAQFSVEEQAQAWFYLGQARCKSKNYSQGREAFAAATKLNQNYQGARAAIK
ncbi:MAG: tetratricopeptide repeat protein, partial [Cyanobacteria bacterium J06558_2]